MLSCFALLKHTLNSLHVAGHQAKFADVSGAMIPPYPSSSATPQQPKVGDAPVHGHENDHWSSAVKHTKDGAKRSVEKEPANLPPGIVIAVADACRAKYRK